MVLNIQGEPQTMDIQYTYDCKLKKICEMLLTTLEHNQHDVIDVIWRLPVWNVKIIRYLASCIDTI
jgi:hypothetical protein